MSSSQDLLVSSGFPDGKPMSKNLLKIRKEMLQNHNRPRVSFLEKGKNVLVNNSEMTAIGEVKHVRNYYIDNTTANVGSSDHGLYTLSKAIAHGAMHDSSERFPPPRCDLIENQPIIGAISAWATDLTASANVLWVTGPPETDKPLLTGIAQRVAEHLVEEGRLGGCFFFDKHIPKRDREAALFSTLAYQIAMNKPEMRGHISSAMHVDPTFPTKSITIQLRDLIARPYRRMMFSSVINPQVSTIIIDALEDCSTATVQLEILRLILAEVEQKTPIPLRFLILSEPKDYIRDLLEDYAAAKLVLRIDLDVREQVDPQTKRSQSHDQVDQELMCRSMPSATPEVMSLLESHFSQRPSPPKPMRPEARIRITGFSPLDVVMNSSKDGTPASSRMQVSGASLTRTDPARASSSSASSPMSVDPVSHFSSLRSAMSVDPKSIPRSRGSSHHSLAAWTTRMEITQEAEDHGRRAARAARKPEPSFHDFDDDIQGQLDWDDGQSVPVPIPLTRRKSPSRPYGRIISSLPGKSWQLVESGADGSNGYWASEVANMKFRCRSCSEIHGPQDRACPQAAGLAKRSNS